MLRHRRLASSLPRLIGGVGIDNDMAHRAAKLTAFALVSMVAWSCGHVVARPTPTPTALTHYSDSYLSFDYPSSWMVSHYTVVSSFYRSIVYLTTQPTHHPCVSTSRSITCTFPVDYLSPGGILIEWFEFGNPAWSLNAVRGSPLKVGGRRAKWDAQKPGLGCSLIGGDESVMMWVEGPMLKACFRSPNLDRDENELRALLASTRFPQSG